MRGHRDGSQLKFLFWASKGVSPRLNEMIHNCRVLIQNLYPTLTPCRLSMIRFNALCAPPASVRSGLGLPSVSSATKVSVSLGDLDFRPILLFALLPLFDGRSKVGDRIGELSGPSAPLREADSGTGGLELKAAPSGCGIDRACRDEPPEEKTDGEMLRTGSSLSGISRAGRLRELFVFLTVAKWPRAGCESRLRDFIVREDVRDGMVPLRPKMSSSSSDEESESKKSSGESVSSSSSSSFWLLESSSFSLSSVTSSVSVLARPFESIINETTVRVRALAEVIWLPATELARVEPFRRSDDALLLLDSGFSPCSELTLDRVAGRALASEALVVAFPTSEFRFKLAAVGTLFRELLRPSPLCLVTFKLSSSFCRARSVKEPDTGLREIFSVMEGFS
jgi:hypothetical protein